MNGWILIPIFLPIIAGVYLLAALALRKDEGEPGAEELLKLHKLTCVVQCVSAALALLAVWTGDKSVTLFYLMKDIPIYFQIDAVGRLFVTVFSIVWVLTCIYSFVYMEHEGKEQRFFGYYLIVYGVLIAIACSGNLVTLYLFYELMTLTSMPMVLHNGSHEAIMAALKYLFYSMCGAYLGLFGIFFLYQYCDTLTFTAGGTLNTALASGHEWILLVAVFGMLIGFGVKAGMLPMHAWLPTAHPVAPSPASAVLSSIIVKSGVLAIIRTVYYVVGADFLRGTWVQTAWMTLALVTVFMGSLLAFREKVFKKRLAYSTVSQVSYILFGLSVLSPTGFEGALLHVVYHAFIKCTLFLTAGIFIFKCSKTKVEELAGIGKQMPKTLWCFTFASLALVGIPPASGFISKWYLAQGALEAEIGVYSYIGPAVLLVSALLTAGYLLSITVKGFFPGPEAAVAVSGGTSGHGAVSGHGTGAVSGAVSGHGAGAADGAVSGHGTGIANGAASGHEAVAAGGAGAGHGTAPMSESAPGNMEPPLGMLVPLAILAALTVLFGIVPNPLISYASRIASLVL